MLQRLQKARFGRKGWKKEQHDEHRQRGGATLHLSGGLKAIGLRPARRFDALRSRCCTA